jgi:hypothetical protein
MPVDAYTCIALSHSTPIQGLHETGISFFSNRALCKIAE